MLVNPNFPDTATQIRDVEAATRALELKLEVARAKTEDEIALGFATLIQGGVGALIIAADPFPTRSCLFLPMR
jgi:putative tryptophan/tyrosine transport system substrate-binding protein